MVLSSSSQIPNSSKMLSFYDGMAERLQLLTKKQVFRNLINQARLRNFRTFRDQIWRKDSNFSSKLLQVVLR